MASFALGPFATVFQAEVYAILACSDYCLRECMTDKTICICSDSQAALLALGSHTVSSRLVLQCRNSLQGLSIYNRVQLFWAPGHCGMVFLRMKREMVLREWDLNPPSAGRNLVCRNHVSYCNLVSGCRHSKGWIKRPCLKMARFLRNLPRNSPYSMANLRTQIFGKPILSVLIGLLTGHVRLNNHLHTMGLLSDPTCAACGIEEELGLHFICVCPTLANLRTQI
jgi:hypothetical protein